MATKPLAWPIEGPSPEGAEYLRAGLDQWARIKAEGQLRLQERLAELRRQKEEQEAQAAEQAAANAQREYESALTTRQGSLARRDASGRPAAMPLTGVGLTDADRAELERAMMEKVENEKLRKGYKKAKVVKAEGSPTGNLPDYVRKVMEARAKILSGQDGEGVELAEYRGMTPDEAKLRRDEIAKSSAEPRRKRAEKLAAIKEQVALRGRARGQGIGVGQLQAQDAVFEQQKVRQGMYAAAVERINNGEGTAIDYIVAAGSPEAGKFSPEAIRGEALKYGLGGLGEAATPESIEALMRGLSAGGQGAAPGARPSGGVTLSDGTTSISIPFTPNSTNVPTNVKVAVRERFPKDVRQGFKAILASAVGDMASAVAAAQSIWPGMDAEIKRAVDEEMASRQSGQTITGRRLAEEASIKEKGAIGNLIDQGVPVYGMGMM